MKKLIVASILFLTLLSSCRDKENMEPETVLGADLEGVWTGTWADEPNTIVEIEIWQRADEKRMKMEYEGEPESTLEMSSETAFTVTEFEDAGLLKRYEAEKLKSPNNIKKLLLKSSSKGVFLLEKC